MKCGEDWCNPTRGARRCARCERRGSPFYTARVMFGCGGASGGASGDCTGIAADAFLYIANALIVQYRAHGTRGAFTWRDMYAWAGEEMRNVQVGIASRMDCEYLSTYNRGFPCPKRLVLAPGCNARAIGGKRHRPHPSKVSL